MNCRTIHITELDDADAAFIVNHLTREGSDFSRKLQGKISGSPLRRVDGWISLIVDYGEIIGWCRTETWVEPETDAPWDTLEAFVSPVYRGRSFAAWAASGLVCGPLSEAAGVAVFAPSMMLLARRIGIFPVLFTQDCEGRWVRA
jgi:hypothetical protein